MIILFHCGIFSSAKAQLDAPFDVKKPDKYDKRVLGSDKTFTTKYTIPRRFTQSLSTHYNFFFNANIKLNDVIAGAKQGFRDDYTELLPFYNYTLDATAAQKTELDSVLIKCNAGILLHDLRNSWIDNMYLLMGKAYFLKKQFDSAGITFQYLNYYFQPKNKDEAGYKKYVGSNLNDEGNIYTVSSKEKKGIPAKIFTEPPSRNDALIWRVRTYIEDSSYSEAAGIIQTLKRDELFPSRLKASLEEMQAYLFYKNEMWDSAANHLSLALDNAETKAEQARWEYLIGQLYTLGKNTAKADEFFGLSVKHTIDPVMEVYARLNKIKLAQGNNDEKIIDENVQQLLKMARRDKYYNYRNIIYYMAAQMEMQRNNFDAAKSYLLKSVKYNSEDLAQRNRSFLYLGNLAFERKEYQLAYSAYDSLDINSPVVKNGELITERKTALGKIVNNLQQIKAEDSLQKIAAMPEAEREKYLKAVAKKLRKERGLKESDSLNASNPNNPLANKTAADMFSSGSEKGDWYFYNNSAKSRGFTAFRNNWGARPNVDNWRRIADVATQVKTPGQKTNPSADVSEKGSLDKDTVDISYEGLMKKLPLTPEALAISNNNVQAALFALGKTFKDKFEDYQEAINNYEALLNRYPDTRYQEEALFDLQYCYAKLNLPVKAKQYKEILSKNFPRSKYIEMIENPKAVDDRKNKLKNDATRNYEKIYNLFLEGNFEEAVKQKAKADSIYGNLYWTQQLLYIEAIYNIKQRQDSLAIDALQNLIHIDRQAPISKKAENIIKVLKRRNDIEQYLTNLQVERAKDDSVTVPEDEKKIVNKEKVANKQVSKAAELPVTKAPVVRPAIDSSQFKKNPPKQQPTGFTYNPADQHYVAIVLNKVDVVYVNEVKNAFNRYNREAFSGQQIEANILPINDDNKLLVMAGFADAAAALDYTGKTKRLAGAQIVPWLAADKYRFVIISQSNLEVLKTNKDLEAYQRFLETNYPESF